MKAALQHQMWSLVLALLSTLALQACGAATSCQAGYELTYASALNKRDQQPLLVICRL